MPTVLSHPAVSIAIGLGLGRKVIPARLLMVGIAISVLTSEIIWVWLPCVITGIFMAVIRWGPVKRKLWNISPKIS